MALSGLTFDPIRIYGKERVLMHLKVTIGATGAVSAVDGRGWTDDGVASTNPNNGSVTRDSAGVYSIVLPGSGSVQDIQLLSFFVEDAAAVDIRVPLVSLTLASRKITLSCVKLAVAEGTAADPDIADPTEGSVLHIALLVRNSPLD